MKKTFGDAGHLIRPLLVFVGVFVLFLAVRGAIIPKNFGHYGHFRPGAMDDERNRTLHFAGHAACETCHADVAEAKKLGRHANVNCESCHGALLQHASMDVSAAKPTLPDTTKLCATCHEKIVGKPNFLPQVVTADHANGMACKDCHQPHNPKI